MIRDHNNTDVFPQVGLKAARVNIFNNMNESNDVCEVKQGFYGVLASDRISESQSFFHFLVIEDQGK